MSLLATPGGRFLAGLLGALLLSVGAYVYGDHRGYARAATTYTAQIAQTKADLATARAAEIERQNAVNDAAKAAEARSIAKMQADNQSLQDQIQELQREADQDPNANGPALGSSSVRRINEIR
ncbi:hypothetical protein DTW90_30725 [Neorhizobium sp. P12A]|uniref:hypothetical protein n=1 Tax=Neorhizobium sp. P12A TaxID=2268027 RepID=UPI0011EBB9C7|nr:hypothetical protein [Neorhizobium sp. P12A]KAA0689868.1 hypothetical protein DTW90_30725 [Neorhizobium sp. P12A]